MKRLSLLSLICISLVFITGTFSFAEEATPPQFSVERLVIAGSIEDREPFGVVDVFSASTELVYCFLDARDIREDTIVSFVWYHGETEMAKVDLTLRAGTRWRTNSSKKLGGRQGDWRVELQDAEGTVVDTVSFSVE